MTTQLLTLALAPAIITVLVVGLRAPLHVLLPVYAALVPFGSSIALPLGLPRQFSSVSSLVGLALTAALLVRLLAGHPGALRTSRALPVWLLLLALAVVSALWSITPGETLQGVLLIAGLVALYVGIALSPVDRRMVQRVETALLLGGVAAAVYGLVQAATGQLPTDGLGGPRFGRDLLGANHTAAALLLPLAIGLTRSMAASTVRAMAVNVAAVAALLTAVLLSGSRGGLLGALVVIVVVGAHSAARTRALAFGLLLAAVLGVVLVVAPAGIGERQTQGGSSGRTDIWHVGAAACETYCLTGSGWATFPQVYRETQASVPDAQVIRRGDTYEPHNIWLLVGVEAGLAGLVLLTLGLALTAHEALHIPRGTRGPPLAGLGALLVTAVFLSNFEFKYFWMVLIYVTIAARAEDDTVQPVSGLALADARSGGQA